MIFIFYGLRLNVDRLEYLYVKIIMFQCKCIPPWYIPICQLYISLLTNKIVSLGVVKYGQYGLKKSIWTLVVII